MTPYQSAVSQSWNDRKRLIRFRRMNEHLRLSEEIKLVPRGLVVGMFALLAVAETVALTLCAHSIPEPWEPVVEFGEKAGLAMVAGIVLGIWLPLAATVFLVAYVNRDAKRRGMNSALWTFLVILMLPAYLAIGFVIYFIAREPLPYHCPKCGTMVTARFNYCPGCRGVLHPSCHQCQREIGELDKYCPHCGNDLAPTAA